MPLPQSPHCSGGLCPSHYSNKGLESPDSPLPLAPIPNPSAAVVNSSPASVCLPAPWPSLSPHLGDPIGLHADPAPYSSHSPQNSQNPPRASLRFLSSPSPQPWSSLPAVPCLHPHPSPGAATVTTGAGNQTASLLLAPLRLSDGEYNPNRLLWPAVTSPPSLPSSPSCPLLTTGPAPACSCLWPLHWHWLFLLPGNHPAASSGL